MVKPVKEFQGLKDQRKGQSDQSVFSEISIIMLNRDFITEQDEDS